MFQNLYILTSGQLADLQVSLNEHCDKLPSSPAFRPSVGSVCCAHFTGKNGGKIWLLIYIMSLQKINAFCNCLEMFHIEFTVFWF